MSSETSSITTGLAKLMDSEKYSDLKLVSEGREFKVHKAIVCMQSPVFAVALDGRFQEATTNTINIEFDAGTVERMVAFLYKGDYDDNAKESGSDSESETENVEVGIVNQGAPQVAEFNSAIRPRNPDEEEPSTSTTLPLTTEILCNVKVNAIADYYDIPELKELANTKIQNIFKTKWSPNNFSEIVEEVFNLTSDTALHKIITSTAVAHIEELIKDEDFMTGKVTSEFVHGVLHDTVTANKAREELSTKNLHYVKSDLLSVENDYRRIKSAFDEMITRTDLIERRVAHSNRTLRGTKFCRNVSCNAEFNCYIERYGVDHDPKYLLRCTKCQCRHWGSDTD